MRSSLALFTSLILFANCAQAEWEPALIGTSKNSFPNKVVVPRDTPEGTHYVRCELSVGNTGRTRFSYCYAITSNTSDLVVRAVRRASLKARFQNALDGGKPVRVYMHSTVVVHVQEGKAVVSAFPNAGVNIKQFGWDYVAPQRVNEFIWHHNSSKNGYNGSWTRGSRRVASWHWIRLKIDASGAITNSEITTITDNASQHELRSLQKSIDRMSFRPGLVKGKPTPMVYVESARRYK